MGCARTRSSGTCCSCSWHEAHACCASSSSERTASSACCRAWARSRTLSSSSCMACAGEEKAGPRTKSDVPARPTATCAVFSAVNASDAGASRVADDDPSVFELKVAPASSFVADADCDAFCARMRSYPWGSSTARTDSHIKRSSRFSA